MYLFDLTTDVSKSLLHHLRMSVLPTFFFSCLLIFIRIFWNMNLVLDEIEEKKVVTVPEGLDYR